MKDVSNIVSKKDIRIFHKQFSRIVLNTFLNIWSFERCELVKKF